MQDPACDVVGGGPEGAEMDRPLWDGDVWDGMTQWEPEALRCLSLTLPSLAISLLAMDVHGSRRLDWHGKNSLQLMDRIPGSIPPKP